MASSGRHAAKPGQTASGNALDVAAPDLAALEVGRRPKAATLAVLLAGFVALLIGVEADGPVVSADLGVRTWVLAHHPSGLVALSTAVTDVGNPEVSVIALLVVAAALSLWRGTAAPLLLALLGAGALTAAVLVLKTWVGRGGPALSHGHVGTGYFPSGHTTSSFLCYGLIALLLTYGGPAWRYGAAFRVGLCAAALIGTAMVYSNFHWLSDVLAGGTLGGVLLWAAVAAAARWPGVWAPDALLRRPVRSPDPADADGPPRAGRSRFAGG